MDCLTQKTQEPEKEIQSYFEDDEDDLYDDVEAEFLYSIPDAEVN